VPEPISKVVVVSNTGPLISAFQCSRIYLLQRYFEAIHIPASELEEFERHRAGRTIHNLINANFVRVERLTVDEKEQAAQIAKHIAESALANVKDPAHHLPEAEAMVLMGRKNLGASRILLEERAAREVAHDLGLPLTGFIGVLLRACRDKLLTANEMRELLETCRRQGTRYSNELIVEMTRRCEEVRKL
jgi:predicted nucleic acid-binding protein